MLDVTNGVLYIAVSVTDPSKPQTIVVTVLQDALGMQPHRASFRRPERCHTLAGVRRTPCAIMSGDALGE